MATLRPLKGLRPLPIYAQEVASRPYDVLSSEEARSEAAGNPFSFLRVTKPEIDLPAEVDLYDESVYRKGQENLRRLMDDGILCQDLDPSLYLYAQTMQDRVQYGIVGCVSASEYTSGLIRRHELTRQDKEDDRTRHVMATNAHTGPVFLMHRANSALSRIVQEVRSTSPVNDFVADDGVRHQVWVISQKDHTLAITDAFHEVGRMYVADGHHRCAAGVRVAEARAANNRNNTGHEEYNYILAVAFPIDQLRIMPYNRVVTDLNGRTEQAFLNEIRQTFTVMETAHHSPPARKGEFGMYLQGRWHTLIVPSGFLKTSHPVERLDISLLQRYLLSPILGIDDPRTSKRIDFVGGMRGISELEQRVNSGEMAVAFALHATSVEELLAVADAGMIMPPKSTWFEPKLRDGLVVHLLE
jgi:uncharacterized protein (DUF1015 family)